MVGTRLHLDGQSITSESDLHDEIEKQLAPPVYGRNLNALDEVLLQMLETPIEIVWASAAQSKALLGERFDEFVEVFRDAENEYAGEYRFTLRMDD